MMFVYPLSLIGLISSVVFVSLAATIVLLHKRQVRQKNTHLLQNMAQLGLLRRLLAELQRHRGLSNGVLAGDKSLEPAQYQTRQHIDAYLQQASTYQNRHSQGWINIIDHWSRLRHQTNSTARNNLLQHNQIIANCIFLIDDIANELDLSAGHPDLRYLSCIWQHIIQTAEWTGQARALGTGIAATGNSLPEQRVRLRFLHQKIQQLSQQAFATLRQQLPPQIDEGLFHLSVAEHNLSVFLHGLEHELIQLDRPSIDAQTYFKQATQAIDSLLTLVDSALEHMHKIHNST